MSTIIMDLCSYTRLGLTGYLLIEGLKKEKSTTLKPLMTLP
ncbi:colanic acid capsullar biosynthesis activation protein A [Escherichia coli]|uniref:Colanic acid capsullar biosynthesis activation protein A n=1 Tax=Escherichia coli TaxID=562 RepID=A0A376VTQ2_ECOLX|nr:colanic acid capsullar biosynthesis activation protein A [Escherichia coli]